MLFVILKRFLYISLVLLVCNSALGDTASKPSQGRIIFQSDNKNNIFQNSTGQLLFTIKEASLLKSGTIIIENENGHVIQTIQLSANKASVPVALSLPGFYKIKTSCIYTDNYSEIKETTAVILPLPLTTDTKSTSPAGLWHTKGDLDMTISAGSAWTRRIWVITGYNKAEDGSIIPKKLPQITRENDINWIGSLGKGFPEWITSTQKYKKGELYEPQNWDELTALIQQFAKDVQPFPPYFEVYNEPEAHWKGDDRYLIQLHSTVAHAIRSVHPDVKILGPTFYSVNLKKIQKVIKLGILKDLDGLSVHNYVNGTPPENEFIQNIINLKKILSQEGYPNFPIYLTEFGWTTEKGRWKSVDPLTQAQYLSRAAILLSQQDINAYLCFSLWSIDPIHNDVTGFSLLDTEGFPKPAFAAYMNTMRELSSAKKGGQLISDPDSNLYCALFKLPKGYLMTPWNTGNQNLFLVLPSTGIFEIKDMMGRIIQKPSNKIINLTGNPFFIHISDSYGGNLEIQKCQVLKINESCSIPLKSIETPANMIFANGKLTIQEGSKPGIYILMGHSANSTVLIPVNVL